MTPMAEDELPIYVVRLAELAARQVEDEWQHQAETGSAASADTWRAGFRAALATLATLPGRCSPAAENAVYAQFHPGETLRQLIYRRRQGGPAWRLLFTIHAQTDTDPPAVRVHQVRHGAQPSLTQWPDAPSEP